MTGLQSTALFGHLARSRPEKKYLPISFNNIAAISGLPLGIGCYAQSRR